jgi:hypothetical protein
MLRTGMVAVLLGALVGTASAQSLPQRSYPMTREMYTRQIEFWNDRADLARLYDLAVTFEGGWRFYDPRALGRLDERVLRFFDDQLAEARRELARDERSEGTRFRGQYRRDWRGGPGYDVQRVGGRDSHISRREIDELTRMRFDYERLRGRHDQGSLSTKWSLVQRLIQMENDEIRRDERWLRSQGWNDPAEGRY